MRYCVTSNYSLKGFESLVISTVTIRGELVSFTLEQDFLAMNPPLRESFARYIDLTASQCVTPEAKSDLCSLQDFLGGVLRRSNAGGMST